jgi:hypothetical protein
METCPSTCAFNNGVDMIPDHDFCAVAWMNPDTSVILGCGAKTADKATCDSDAQCKWYKGKTVAPNNELSATGGSLLETNFCHPAILDGITTTLPACLTEKAKDLCEAKGCLWSTGKAMTPDHDFCSVENVNAPAD